MPAIFLEITLVLVLASFLGTLASFFKQPLVLAYIFTGLISAPILSSFTSREVFNSFAQVGIALLLFLVGLELKLRELEQFSKKIPVITFVQILFTLITVTAISRYLGFSQISSIFLGVVSVFSSTALGIKLLSDKRSLDSLYGQIIVGVLIIQDLAAIILLIVLSQGSNTSFAFTASAIILKVITLVVLVILLKEFLLKPIFERLAKNLEVLFLGSVAYVFLLAAVANYLDFSAAAGAFLAGLSLANTREEYQIASRVRPLRDFFLLIFFVFLGTQVSLDKLSSLLFPAFVISLVIILVKVGSVLAAMFYLGFRKRTAFFSALSLAQVSEFSLILILVAAGFAFVEAETVSLVTLISLITFALSSYLVLLQRRIISYLNPILSLLERKNPWENIKHGGNNSLEDHVVLVGCGRLGSNLLPLFKKKKIQILVVDFNPQVISALTKEGIHTLFGDITDPQILEAANLTKAKLIVSTVFDKEDNLEILAEVKKKGTLVTKVVTAPTEKEALELYANGANYCIIPRILGGEKTVELLLRSWKKEINLSRLKEIHLKELKERMED